MSVLAIDSIVVGERYRKEFGDIASLAASINAIGLLHPVVVTKDGRLIAGARRLEAASSLGWTQVPVTVVDMEEVVFGEHDENEVRESFRVSERVAIGKEIEKRLGERRGRPGLQENVQEIAQLKAPRGKKTRQIAAKKAGFGNAETYRQAKAIVATGAPELIEAVDNKVISIAEGAAIAKRPAAEQKAIVETEPGDVLGKAKGVRSVRQKRKIAAKVAATEAIAANNKALPVGARKYSAIYADPPWSFKVWSGAGKDRAAENHYPTMTQAEIEALPVPALAADDCVLFLWAVMPQLPEALAVIKAWGFEYKTCAFVWVKTTQDGERPATGMGYWTRANVELCFIATKGSPVRLNADVHQVIQAPRMEHSRKPDEVAERIERLVPGPYLEMFSRRSREGWDSWGNQAAEAA